MKTIEVNNGRQLVLIPDADGITIEHRDHTGATESAEHYDDGEIVMLSNLAHYMREKGLTDVILKTADGPEEFPIFQRSTRGTSAGSEQDPEDIPEQYRPEKLTPGQQIPPEVYAAYLTIGRPKRLPYQTAFRALKKRGIETSVGFLADIPQRTENGRPLFPAFGRTSKSQGETFRYLGLSSEASRSWRAYIRSWPETEREKAARYAEIERLKAEGWSGNDLADYYDMHPHYDSKGYGICEECGKVIAGSAADAEIYGYESPDTYRDDLPEDPEDPEA